MYKFYFNEVKNKKRFCYEIYGGKDLLGEIYIDKHLTLNLNNIGIFHFSKETFDENNTDNLNRLLNYVFYNTSVLKQFLSECAFNTFDTYEKFMKIYRAFIEDKAFLTKEIEYNNYLNFLKL